MFSSRSISTKFAWLALLSGAAGLSAQINPNQINFAGQTGCTTATYPYVPADSQCEAPSAYTLTDAKMATAVSGLTGCTTAGYAWVPEDSACEAVGGQVQKSWGTGSPNTIATPAVIQSKSTGNTSASGGTSLVMTSSVTAGHSIVFIYNSRTASCVPTVSDTLLTPLTFLFSYQPTSGSNNALVYAGTAIATGADTISFSGCTGQIAVAYEVSNLSAFIDNALTSGSGTSIPLSATTSVANDVAFTFMTGAYDGSYTQTLTSGWNLVTNSTQYNNLLDTGYYVTSAVGSYTATWGSGGSRTAGLFTLKAANTGLAGQDGDIYYQTGVSYGLITTWTYYNGTWYQGIPPVMSGMTAGQIPIAATSGTVTSSKALGGTGAAIATGPASSTANDIVIYADTSGTQQDSAVAITNVVTAVTPYSPVTASISGHTLSLACPTCGIGSGGTSVSQNSGAAETDLPITGFMPQVCADSSGSTSAKVCTTVNIFTPQALNCVLVSSTTNNGTALTLNVNSLGPKSVAQASATGWTTTLTLNTMFPNANTPVQMCYDGTNWNASGTGYAASGVTSTGWTTLSFNSTPTTTFPGCGSAEAYQSTISIPMSYGTALRIKASLVRPNTSTGMDVAVATAATGVGGYEIAAQSDKNQVLYYFNSSGSNTAITASGTTYSYDQALPTPLNLAVYPMSSTENYLLGSTMVATVNNGVAQSQSISGQNGTLDLGSSSVYVFVCAPSSAAGIVGAAYMLSPTPW